VIEPGHGGSTKTKMAASMGIEPMIDGEEEKVAPAGPTTSNGDGGDGGHKRKRR
jgi:hypothetical protein